MIAHSDTETQEKTVCNKAFPQRADVVAAVGQSRNEGEEGQPQRGKDHARLSAVSIAHDAESKLADNNTDEDERREEGAICLNWVRVELLRY